MKIDPRPAAVILDGELYRFESVSAPFGETQNLGLIAQRVLLDAQTLNYGAPRRPWPLEDCGDLIGFPIGSTVDLREWQWLRLDHDGMAPVPAPAITANQEHAPS